MGCSFLQREPGRADRHDRTDSSDDFAGAVDRCRQQGPSGDHAPVRVQVSRVDLPDILPSLLSPEDARHRGIGAVGGIRRAIRIGDYRQIGDLFSVLEPTRIFVIPAWDVKFRFIEIKGEFGASEGRKPDRE
jgi:hypothetical protein